MENANWDAEVPVSAGILDVKWRVEVNQFVTIHIAPGHAAKGHVPVLNANLTTTAQKIILSVLIKNARKCAEKTQIVQMIKTALALGAAFLAEAITNAVEMFPIVTKQPKSAWHVLPIVSAQGKHLYALRKHADLVTGDKKITT